MNNIIFGRNTVIEAIKSGRKFDKIYISKSARNVDKLVELAKSFAVVVKFVNPEKINFHCNRAVKTQGVVAFATSVRYFEIDEILNFTASADESPFFLICDGIEDPHNLGALLRTAEAAGVSGVVVSKARSAPINETVEKTSAGALNFLKIARVSNLSQAVTKLKKAGIFVYAAEADGINYREFDFAGPVALIVGSEGYGVSSLLKKKSDGICKLPMFGKVNSLNVSVAGGILMYEILRHRFKK